MGDFTLGSREFSVVVRGWPGPPSSWFSPFLVAGAGDWLLWFDGAGAVAVDAPTRTVRAPRDRLTEGVIASLCAAAAERNGAVLVHAAAVAANGRALLLLAPAEGGKTTLSGYLSETQLLSDEAVLLFREGAATRVAGTPVWSRGARAPGNASAPLAAVLLLEKGSENRLSPASAALALESVLRQTYAPPGRPAASVFAFLRRAVEGVPAFRFRFRNDPTCANAVAPLFREGAA